MQDTKFSREELFARLHEINPIFTDEKISVEEKLKIILSELNSTNLDRLHIILIYLRKLLSTESASSVDYVVEIGFVPKLALILDVHAENESLIMNATWVLISLAAASDKAIEEMRDLALQYKLVMMVVKGNDSIKEQALWVLANIASENIEARDELIQTCLIEQLTEIVSRKSLPNILLKVAVWAISNLCKGKPTPPLERLKGFIEPLGRIIFCNHEEIISDALWAISYISEGERATIKIIRQNVNLTQVAKFLKHEQPLIQRPALRILGNICVGDIEDVKDVVKTGCLEDLVKIVNTTTYNEFLREICWAFSNIVADSIEQVDNLINSGALKALIALFNRKQDLFIRKEVLWALANTATSANSKQIEKIIDMGILDVLSEMLEIKDVQLLNLSLDVIYKILDFGAKSGTVNGYASRFESIGGKAKLEKLQTLDNKDVYLKSVQVLKRYYSLEEFDIMPEENAYVMEVDSNYEHMPQ